MVAGALSEVPSGPAGGLSYLNRGRSNSPQFGTADAAFRAVTSSTAAVASGPSTLQIPAFTPR